MDLKENSEDRKLILLAQERMKINASVSNFGIYTRIIGVERHFSSDDSPYQLSQLHHSSWVFASSFVF
jgi:hypothetical protein